MNSVRLVVGTFSATLTSSTSSGSCRLTSLRAARIFLAGVLTLSTIMAYGQATGTADPTWSITPIPNQNLYAIAVQPGGKVVAVGRHLSIPDINIYRFDLAGNPDVSFGNAGKVITELGNANSTVSDVAIDSSGRIYVAGTFRDAPPRGEFRPDVTGFAVTRRRADGSLDYSFGYYGFSKVPLNGVTIFDEAGMPNAVRDIAFQPDGKLLLMTVGHEAEAPAGVQSIAIIRFDTNGQLDPAFAAGGLALIRIPGNNGSPNLMRIGKDGTIFVAGGEDDNARGFVIKLSSQGIIEPDFGPGGRVSIEPGDKFYVTGLGVQDDNKIVVAGRRWRTNESPEGDGVLALRLNSNGSLDTGFGTAGYSFHNPSSVFDFAATLALEPGGNILLSGSTSSGSDISAPGTPVLIRLTQSGQLDTGFAGTGIITTAGLAAADLKVFDAAYLLTRNLRFPSGTDNNLFSVRKFITRTPTAAPQTSINGANQTIADTDRVAGEVVTVTGTATDSDGTIAYTDWVLNGAPAATGPSATFTLQNGANLISFTAIDNNSAKATTTVTYDVLAPTVPLPRISAASSLGEETFDSQFSIAIRNASNVPVITAPISQSLTMTGFIFPREGYKNFGADIFVVAATASGWFMRDVDGEFVPWNRNLATLVPAYKNQALADPLRVPVYAGRLPLPGLYQIFLGFRIQGSSELIYSIDTGAVTVTAP